VEECLPSKFKSHFFLLLSILVLVYLKIIVTHAIFQQTKLYSLVISLVHMMLLPCLIEAYQVC
jgi:hypothetical protein